MNLKVYGFLGAVGSVLLSLLYVTYSYFTYVATAFATMCFCYTIFYFTSMLSRVHIHSKHTALNKHLIDLCPHLRGLYWPSFYVFNRHLQGIFLMRLRTKVDPNYKREVYIAEDGGSLELDWGDQESPDLPMDAPVMLLISGVTGSSQSSYITYLMVESRKRGWRAVVMNYPGATGTPLTSPRFFCLDSVSDTREFVEHVAKRYPKAPLFAVGFSLGGHFFAKYLESVRHSTPLRAFVAISSPWSAKLCYDFWEGQWIHENVYDKHFLNRFQGDYAKNLALFKEKLPHLDHDRILTCTNTLDFHESLSVPLFGFRSIDGYWEAYDSGSDVASIAIPFLALHAWNDPVVPPNAVPVSALVAMPLAILAATNEGGHTGWMSGWRLSSLAWCEKVILEYIEAMLQPTTLTLLEAARTQEEMETEKKKKK